MNIIKALKAKHLQTIKNAQEGIKREKEVIVDLKAELRKLARVTPRTRCEIEAIIYKRGGGVKDRVEVKRPGRNLLPVLREAVRCFKEKFKRVPESSLDCTVFVTFSRSSVAVPNSIWSGQFTGFCIES